MEATRSGEGTEPSDAFTWRDGPAGRLLICTALDDRAHGWTTRELRLERPDSESGDEWGRVAASAGVGLSHLVRLTQVHGRDVIVVDGPRSDRPTADGVVTKRSDLALAVRTADCVPLLMGGRDATGTGAVHAGWRGTMAGIAGHGVERLHDAFGLSPEALVVAIGPSIGPCCYRVGPEVRDAFVAAGWPAASIAAWFVDEGGLRLDLWRANADQLIASGVPRDAVHVSGLCTACRGDLFYSYRRDGKGTGRMVGFIGGA